MADRIREAIGESGKSQSAIARALGITPQAITKALRFGHLAKHHVSTFCRETGVNEAWLLEGSSPKERSDSPAEPPLPVDGSDSDDLGYIAVRRVRLRLSAGVSGFAIEYENDEAPAIFFRREWFQSRRLNPDKLLGLKVSGASMEPGLYDGDTIVANTADTNPADGEVFAINYEGELVIKRMKRDGGEWWLASDNDDKRRYPDKRVGEGVILLGRVVYKSSERI